MKIYVVSNSVGRCFLTLTLKEAEKVLKENNLGNMPKFDGMQNGIRYYVGINKEDCYIQVCELDLRKGGTKTK